MMVKTMKVLSVLMIFATAMGVLVACGGKSPVVFKVEFMVDDAVYSTLNTNGDEVIQMPEDPIKDGYYFDGWYWDNESWLQPFTANSLLDTPLSGNMKVYAKWNDEDSLEGTQARFDGFTSVCGYSYSLVVANAVTVFDFNDAVEVNNKSSLACGVNVWDEANRRLSVENKNGHWVRNSIK